MSNSDESGMPIIPHKEPVEGTATEEAALAVRANPLMRILQDARIRLYYGRLR